ncbi:Cytosolic Fe-S cluster assembly factor like [Actinidia chinensis var. chinensis]|uniref:Cytosolic Fe-S cluster assembly factor like n=1 Tax=Actinidia chinensis var. chinensis TaxID=1590841 RepID=A0A2R6PSD7_ACTCC|nr:Cytosolic Fe-S cluster assembly factor like [Actinidia chinensis var. chinensis]
MTTLLQISINLSALNSSLDYRSKQWISRLILSKPIAYHPVSIPKIGSLNQRRFRLGVSRETWSFLEMGRGKDVILMGEEGWKRKRRVVVAKFNQGFGGGGGGGRVNSARVLGNLALAIGLTYLSMTGQLGWLFDAIGWVLDAIVSLWLLAVVLPLVGLGTFLWWAAQDMVQDSCPNCGNEFQIFKSTVNDTLQLCPYCSQPFSVVGNEFVSDPVNFSNQSTAAGKGFKNFSARSNKKENNFSTAVVDVEAEVEDID